MPSTAVPRGFAPAAGRGSRRRDSGTVNRSEDEKGRLAYTAAEQAWDKLVEKERNQAREDADERYDSTDAERRAAFIQDRLNQWDDSHEEQREGFIQDAMDRWENDHSKPGSS